MKRRHIILGGMGLALVALYALNNSWSADPSGELQIMAHRGVHHTYGREGLSRDACTATRIHAPTHGFIENTRPSTAEAFRLGAHVVEIDVHPTTDGEFAVFHDWTLDCRTDGTGVTRDQSMAYLKRLDVGHGYTADGGQTFPLRGQGVGLMPTLNEMLDAFPERRFLINIKSNDPGEADLLHAYLEARADSATERLTFYGGDRPMARLRQLRPDARILSKATLKACVRDYALIGWTGRVPEACADTVIFVPGGWGPVLWGWPDRFLQRMQSANSEVWIGGAPDFNTGSLAGLDDPGSLHHVPQGWRGGVDTDRIELIAPALQARSAGT